MIASNKEVQLASAANFFTDSNESSISLQPASQMTYDSGYNHQMYSDSLSYNAASSINKSNSFNANNSYSVNDYDRSSLLHLTESYASFMVPNGMCTLIIQLLKLS